jgi:hypothetical protein
MAVKWESAVSKKVFLYHIFLIKKYENQATKKKKKVLNTEEEFPVAKIQIFANDNG